MTKQLEQFFNLPGSDDIKPLKEEPEVKEDKTMPTEVKTQLASATSTLDKIDSALEQVTSLDSTDKELDELADLAKDKFGDLVDLAMGVEPRFSGPILQAAGALLGHSVSAKTAKIDRKMRTLELQIRKAKLDADLEKRSKQDPEEDAPIQGTAREIDRNELLSTLISEMRKNNNAGK